MSEVPELPEVTGVDVVRDYVLRLTFADGVVGEVSFVDEDWHGVFEPFRDPDVFAEVQLDSQFGTIMWPNGLDMAPEPLYEAAVAHPVAGARARG